MVLGICLSGGCTGAGGSTSRPPLAASRLLGDGGYLSAAQAAWVDKVVGPCDGDRIVTIYVEPLPDWRPGVTVVNREAEGGRIVAKVHTLRGIDVEETRTAYEIANPEAIAMFRNLQRQIAMGFRFVAGPPSRGAGVTYAVATGVVHGVTLDVDGLEVTQTVASEVNRWRAQESVGNKIEDADLSELCFSRDAYASPATAILQALSYFDYLCELAQRSQTDLSSKRPYRD